MRKIKVVINDDGSVKLDNSQNSDEALILAELAELAGVLNGDVKAFKVEAHVHDHNHNHDKNSDHVHAGMGTSAAPKFTIKKTW